MLGPADFAIHSAGDSGRFKTEVAALAQQHFGAGMGARALPLSWTSTSNSMEGLLYVCKDALAVADDFLPAGLPHAEREAMLRAASRVFRAQGNRAGRSRMRADASLRAPKAPRGLLYSTGEEIPPGLSQVARVWVIELAKDAITSERLTVAQRVADAYPRAMAAYIRWLAPGMGRMTARIRAEVDELRDVYRAAHRRTPEIAANLEIGWNRFLAFAVDSGALTAHNRTVVEARVRAALLRGAVVQSRHQRDNSPIEKFLSGLQAALAAGAVHVSGPVGKLPEQPGSWGWRHRTLSLVGDADDRWEPRGERIGWLAGSELYLVPEVAFKAASAMHRDGVGVDLKALGALLQDSGHLVRSDGERRQTVKAPMTVDLTRTRVWCMQADLSSGSSAPNKSLDAQPSTPPARLSLVAEQPCPDEAAPIAPMNTPSSGQWSTVTSDTTSSSEVTSSSVNSDLCPDCPDCPDDFQDSQQQEREKGGAATPATPEPRGVLCRAQGCGGLAWRWDEVAGDWRCRKCGGPLPPWLLKEGA